MISPTYLTLLSLILAPPQKLAVDSSTAQWTMHQLRADSVINIVRRLQGALDLDRWTLTVRFDSLADDEGEWEAWTEAAPEYREAEIAFNLPLVLAACNTAIHELLHVHLWAYTAIAEEFVENNEFAARHLRKEEELLVTTLAAALEKQLC